jgi:hypothetical protein
MFTARPSLLLFAMILCSFSVLVNAPAHAEELPRVKKSTTTITVKESENDADEEPKAKVTPEEKERVKSVVFGSRAQSGTLGCKTEELINGAIKDLKSDCAAWVKDQKTELKGRFLTSSCEDSCTDCGMSLQRCIVTGTVHYIIK